MFNSEENKNAEKLSVSEQIVYAVAKPSKYGELLAQPKGSFIKFVILMMLILSIVTFAIPTAALIASFGGFEKLITEHMPRMSSKDGNLHIDEPFDLNLNEYKIVIDTSEPTVSDAKLDKQGMYIAVGSETIRIAVSLGDSVMDYRTASFKGMLADDFSNEKLTSIVPPIYIALVFTFISMAVVFFVKYAFYSMLLYLVFSPIIKMNELDYRFGDFFRLAFYAQTLGYVLVNFNDALRQPIPYFIMSVIAVFVTFGILKNVILNMIIKKKGLD